MSVRKIFKNTLFFSTKTPYKTFIQSVQKVWKHPNENVTHNFSKKSKDGSISVLKNLSADSVCSVFSMTLKKLLFYIKIFAEIIENVQNEFYYLLGYCQDLQGQHLDICCKNYSCLSKLKFSLFSNNQLGFFRKFLM
jgi:hypothetical protein